MARTVMIDGQLVPPERALVSVFDRGFLYGDSVFESWRSYGSRSFALDEHLARLGRSAARVLIELPVPIDVLHAEVERALAAHGALDCYVRLTLTRGVGRSLGLDPELAEMPLRVIVVTELAPQPEGTYERGIAAITYRAERPSDVAAVAEAKVGNYLLAVLAGRAARERGAREALLENAEGEILEAATANVFAVFGCNLRTPAESSPILPGITRAHVLGLAPAAGLRVELAPLSKRELLRADEIFVCSSLRELVPVVSIDGQRVGAGVPGPVTLDLLERYRTEATRA